LFSAKSSAVPKGAVFRFLCVPAVIMVSVTAARVAARSRAASNGVRPTAVISKVWKAGSIIGIASESIVAASRPA
jgi:hypothetical protein